MKSKTIIIRDVDASVVNKIDWLAAQKKQSREEYLRMLLRRLTEAPFLVERNASYIEVMTMLEQKIEEHKALIEAIREDLK